jgi:hypothetical protein
MDIGQIAIVAAVVIYVIFRRFTGQPLQAKTLLLPLALTAFGVYQMRHDHVSALDVGFLLISAILGLAAGAARGATIRIYTRDGHLWQRYRLATLGVWIATIALRFGLSAAGHWAGVDLNTGDTLMVMFGLSLLAEAGIVAARAARTGIPYAPGRRDGRRDRGSDARRMRSGAIR